MFIILLHLRILIFIHVGHVSYRNVYYHICIFVVLLHGGEVEIEDLKQSSVRPLSFRYYEKVNKLISDSQPQVKDMVLSIVRKTIKNDASRFTAYRDINLSFNSSRLDYITSKLFRLSALLSLSYFEGFGLHLLNNYSSLLQ